GPPEFTTFRARSSFVPFCRLCPDPTHPDRAAVHSSGATQPRGMSRRSSLADSAIPVPDPAFRLEELDDELLPVRSAGSDLRRDPADHRYGVARRRPYTLAAFGA